MQRSGDLQLSYNYIQQHLLPRESFNSFISEGGIRDVFNLHVLWLEPVTLPFARE